MPESDIGAEGMFALFNDHPSLLPAAPWNATTNDLRTRASEGHPCVHCGQTSTKAYLAIHASDGRKWLDLCDKCNHWVRQALARIQARVRDGSTNPWEGS